MPSGSLGAGKKFLARAGLHPPDRCSAPCGARIKPDPTTIAEANASPVLIASRRRSNPSRGRTDGWIASSLSLLAMSGYNFAFSRRIAPKLCQKFLGPLSRGRTEDRVRAAPAVSCAVCTESARMSITGQRRTSDIPCARKSTDAKNIGKSKQSGSCVLVCVPIRWRYNFLCKFSDCSQSS